MSSGAISNHNYFFKLYTTLVSRVLPKYLSVITKLSLTKVYTVTKYIFLEIPSDNVCETFNKLTSGLSNVLNLQ